MNGALTQSLYQGTVTSSRLIPPTTLTVTLVLSAQDAANPQNNLTVVPEMLVGDVWRQLPAHDWQGGQPLALTWHVPVGDGASAFRFSLDVPALLSVGGTLTLN